MISVSSYRILLSGLLVLLTMLMDDGLMGQIYLQVEHAGLTKVTRYSVGDRLDFKTRDIQGWQRGVLERLLPEPQSLVLSDAIVNLDEISHVRLYHRGPRIAGHTLIGAGSSWLLMGGVIEGLRVINAIETGYDFGVDTLTIGLSAIISGYLINRFLGTTVASMSKRSRVRIIDLRP